MGIMMLVKKILGNLLGINDAGDILAVNDDGDELEL